MPNRKPSAKSKLSPDPPARLSPVPSLVVSDDESTLGQADRDPPAKEGQTDLTSEEQTVRQPACATTMFTYVAFLSSSSCKLAI